MAYSHLFETGNIGNVTLKNRIVMPAMGTNLAGAHGEVTDHLIRYYEERAQGGTGLIITEFTSIDYEYGKGMTNQLRIDDDRFLTGFYRLANAIHKYGAKLFVQLHHAGRQSNSGLLGGKQIVAPSPVTCEAIGEEPRELTTNEVKEIIQKFIKGAVRCKHAGIDGVELHGAHGYLINQFLGPCTNLRTDEYGGNFENRMRFLEEIVTGIKAQCGEDFPVTVRLSIDEFDEGGLKIELSKKISRYLEKVGVDGLHASAGNYNSSDKIIESPLYEQGWKVYLAEAIKSEVNIPVIAVGSIREPSYVDSILAKKKADFVAIGRGLIADPEWARKAYEDRENEIRMCISCLHCIYSKGHVACSINARAGRELEFPELKPVEKHQIVVVGGGPGGMETARVLSLKGYKVTLFEKTAALGGQLKLVDEPVYRKKMTWYVDYLRLEMERLQVELHLNTEATIEQLLALQPYAIILATGGKPLIPDIKGCELPNVHQYEVLKRGEKTFYKKKIAVLGSGMICYGTARRLAEQGNEVTLIELSTKSGRKIGVQTRSKLFTKLKQQNVEILSDHKVREILPNAIILTDVCGKIVELPIDGAVLTMGVAPYNPLEEICKNHFENVFVIGDAAGFASLSEATRGGFETAYLLETLVTTKKEKVLS